MVVGVLLTGRRSIFEFTVPLEKLREHTAQISQGDYSKDGLDVLMNNQFAEISSFSYAFDRMQKTIQDQIRQLQANIEMERRMHALELENMQAKMALSETETALMQSLISPHFMFNCLNLLSSSAIIEKAPTVYQYSVMIAKYLREALNYIGKNISLRQEFEFAQHYTGIQKIRFGNRITFSYELDGEAAGAMVPAIIIQPLLENAMVHGVASYLSDGRITVTGKMLRSDENALSADDEDAPDHKKWIRLSVQDNGEGIPADQIAPLLDRLRQPFTPGAKGTGLQAVIYRMERFYQCRIQIHIESEPGKQTTVELVFPCSQNNG